MRVDLTVGEFLGWASRRKLDEAVRRAISARFDGGQDMTQPWRLTARPDFLFSVIKSLEMATSEDACRATGMILRTAVIPRCNDEGEVALVRDAADALEKGFHDNSLILRAWEETKRINARDSLKTNRNVAACAHNALTYRDVSYEVATLYCEPFASGDPRGLPDRSRWPMWNDWDSISAMTDEHTAMRRNADIIRRFVSWGSVEKAILLDIDRLNLEPVEDG